MSRERAVVTLAERQHGVLARRQLLALGLGAEAIKSRLRSGRLHALHRGVYALGRRHLNQRGHWMAAVLAGGEQAVLSHHSAAALWGLVGARTPVDVTSGRGRTGRKGIRLHRARLATDERTRRDGIPVTTVARTLLDLADRADDDRLGRAFEEADRLKLLRIPELVRVCDRAVGRRGVGSCRRLIQVAAVPAEGRTRLEHRFGEFCRRHLNDLPAPLTNVMVLDKEVDAFWPAEKVMVEMDSWEFHGHRSAFERDRARDTAMQVAGYQVVRLTSRRLKNEASAVAAQLRTLLTVARRAN